MKQVFVVQQAERFTGKQYLIGSNPTLGPIFYLMKTVSQIINIVFYMCYYLYIYKKLNLFT